ncbi:MAG: LysR substrate-binding domain-containing protein [Pyrinomonadaceae bacterium]
METKHLRLIKTLAERGGITRSLDRLFLTQSAVSHQLKDLEERLGTKLFIRGKNHRGKDQWKLTDEGEVLYQTAVRVLDEIDKAMDAIQELKHGQQGTIRLATECYTIYHWLPAFMQKMNVLYPKLEIIINMEATHKPLPKLLDSKLDVALTSDPIDEERLKYFQLFRDEVFAVVSSTHPWARKKYVRAEDFATEKLIIHSYPLESVTVYEHFLKPASQTPQQIVPVPLTEATLELVKAEMGVTCMPMWALKPFVSSDDLRFVRIGKTGLTRTHFAAIRNVDSKKKYLADFIENLREEFL